MDHNKLNYSLRNISVDCCLAFQVRPISYKITVLQSYQRSSKQFQKPKHVFLTSLEQDCQSISFGSRERNRPQYYGMSEYQLIHSCFCPIRDPHQSLLPDQLISNVMLKIQLKILYANQIVLRLTKQFHVGTWEPGTYTIKCFVPNKHVFTRTSSS